MEMKINLQQIFGLQANNKNQETCQQSEYDESFQQESSAESKSFDYRYQLNPSIFGDDAEPDHPPFHEQILKEAKKHRSSKAGQNNLNLVKLEASDETFSKSESSVGLMPNQGSLPGERLYYQSKNNMTRKKQEIQRIKQEKLNQDRKQATFKPKINPRSQKICEKAKNKVYKQHISKKQQHIKQQSVPSFVKKEMEEVKNCTFKPELIAKPKSGINRTKDQIFDGLFHESKVKDIKKKLKTEQLATANPSKSKKLSKKQFECFIDRNNEFLNKVQKKNELLLKTSQKFNLQTGHKMFTPKISANAKTHSQYFSTTKGTQQALLSHSSSHEMISQPIFGKNYQEQQIQQNFDSSIKISEEMKNKMKLLHNQVQKYDVNKSQANSRSVDNQIISQASQQEEEEHQISSIENQKVKHYQSGSEFENQEVVETEGEAKAPNAFEYERKHQQQSQQSEQDQIISEKEKESEQLIFQISNVQRQ